jgi:hypothetical protein
VRRAAALVVAALGPLAAIGYLCGSPLLVEIGRLSAASPLPIVFGAVAGHEYWAARYVLEVETRDGTRVEREVARGEFTRLGGPHRARMLWALPLVLAPALPDDAWTPPLAYGFCRQGRLARVLGITGDVRRVAVTATHRGDATRAERDYELWCRQ